MVTVLVSQWLDPGTLGSLELKVTSQETVSFTLTGLLLFEVIVAVDALVTVTAGAV